MAKMASGMDHRCVGPTTTNDEITQHGGHPANTKSCSLCLQHLSLIFDIHMVFNWQLSYPLTSIMWSYCGLRFRAHPGHVFFLSWPLTKCWFSIGSQAHVPLTCWKQGRIVQKLVNANPGLTFSSMQMFLLNLLLCFVYSLKLRTGDQTIYRKPQCKVTKLKSKFYLFLG